MENYIASISYLETINVLDDIVNKLLYSKENGYINLKSKQALEEAKNYLIKFEDEINNSSIDKNFENISEIIKIKKEYLIEKIKLHYKQELNNWAFEVYEKIISNCLLEANVEKYNPNCLENIKRKGYFALNWINNFKHFDNVTQEKIKQKFEKDFKENLNKNYLILDNKTNSTNYEIYFKLRNLIIENSKEFLNLNLDEYKFKLTDEDLNYFKQIQNELKTYKKNAVKDEILLLNSVCEKQKNQSIEQNYLLIKQILDDFSYFKYENKKITLENKIELSKKRLEIFTNTFQNRNFYFEKAIK